MAYRVACEMSQEIAAVVSVAGGMAKDAPGCQPSSPVSILQIHGDADTIVRPEGGHVLGRVEAAPHAAAKEVVGRWGKLNGCSGPLSAAGILDFSQKLEGNETVIARHGTCTGASADLWTVQGGGHVLGVNAESARQVYEYLMAHPKK